MPNPSTAIHIRLPVRTTDALQGKITGWAALSHDDTGAPVYDHDDHWVPTHELESAVHKAFVETSGKGGLGDMHERQGIGDIVESFVADARKREALGFGEGEQGWVVTAHVRDPDVLSDVVEGRKQELSFRGWGVPVPVGNGKFRIEDLQLNLAELVSVVDRGASGNDRVAPRVVLLKRAASAKSSTGGVVMPYTPEERQAKLDAIKAKLGDEMFADLLQLVELAAMPAQAAAAPIVNQDEPKTDEQKDTLAKTEDEKKDEEQKRMLNKRLEADPAIKAEFDELRSQNEELRKRFVTAERDRRERIALEKVRADYPHVPGIKPEALARILQRSEEALDAADHTELCKMLKSVSASVASSDLLRTSGAGGDGAETGGYSKLRELAKRHAAEKGTSYGQAFQAVCASHPDLYAEARKG